MAKHLDSDWGNRMATSSKNSESGQESIPGMEVAVDAALGSGKNDDFRSHNLDGDKQKRQSQTVAKETKSKIPGIDLSAISLRSLANYKSHYNVNIPRGLTVLQFRKAIDTHFRTIEVHEEAVIDKFFQKYHESVKKHEKEKQQAKSKTVAKNLNTHV